MWQFGNYILSKQNNKFKVRLSGSNRSEYFNNIEDAMKFINDKRQKNVIFD